MKELLLFFIVCLLASVSGLAQQPPRAIVSCDLPEISELSPAPAAQPAQASDRTVNTLCVTFLVANDAQLTANASTMTSIVNGINTWLTNTHNPLTGPDYQIGSWQRVVMPTSYTASDGTVVNLTIAGNSNGGAMLGSATDWLFDIGDGDLCIVVAPNSSGYNPGQANWLGGENQIGESPDQPAIAVIRSSSNTIINFTTLVFVHEVFGHLQGLDFGGNPHSSESCNGNTDFINAAPTVTQICSQAVAQIGLATDNGSLACSALLPLELLDFRARRSGQSTAQLDWTTENEAGLAGFSIEKSRDGLRWLPVGEVAAKGSPDGHAEYGFLDPGLGTAAALYRLRMTDLDGAARLSPVAEVEPGRAAGWFSVQPNPAVGEARVFFENASPDSPATLRVLAADGRLVLEKSIDAPSAELPIGGLATGIYWLEMRAATGVFVQRLMKSAN